MTAYELILILGGIVTGWVILALPALLAAFLIIAPVVLLLRGNAPGREVELQEEVDKKKKKNKAKSDFIKKVHEDQTNDLLEEVDQALNQSGN